MREPLAPEQGDQQVGFGLSEGDSGLFDSSGGEGEEGKEGEEGQGQEDEGSFDVAVGSARDPRAVRWRILERILAPARRAAAGTARHLDALFGIRSRAAF